jgi:hypothetical protein
MTFSVASAHLPAYSLRYRQGDPRFMGNDKAIAGLRIAYFTEWSPYEETGVLRKLIGQVEAWRELGAEARLFALATRRDEAPALGFADHGDVIGAIHQRALEKYPAARLGYVNKALSVPALRKALRAFAPDVIYYRQNGPWYPGLGSILALAPTAMEINTDEEAEHHLWGAAFNALYRATQGRILDRAAGVVSVTDEIARKYRKLGKPGAVVPNSFWGEAAPLPPTGNTSPAYAFVGSRLNGGESWHGADKIIALARALPDSSFHIVGLTAEDFPNEAIPANVVMHGYKSGDALTEVFARCDVGIGTLALHRKSMEEACPLKVRDYLMRGLPVIIGYVEAEERLNTADYILNIGNVPGNVASHVAEIDAFARNWLGRRVEEDLSFLSRTSKERQRLDFLAGLAARS